jgi:hypothetical protein
MSHLLIICKLNIKFDYIYKYRRMDIKIKYRIRGFLKYFFDSNFGLHYSKDKIVFRAKKECKKKGSLGYKINHKFYSRTGLKNLIYPFRKPKIKIPF